MNDIIKLLESLLTRLEPILASQDDIEFVKDKLELYLDKFFNGNARYKNVLQNIKVSQTSTFHTDTIESLRRLVNNLIDDLKISKSDFDKSTELERQKVIDEAKSIAEFERQKIQQSRQEIDAEKRRVEDMVNEIKRLNEDLQSEKQRVLAEEEKYNVFKTKLEVSDKRIDFQDQAMQNRAVARLWALAASILMALLLFFLYKGLDIKDEFISIVELTKHRIQNMPEPTSGSVLSMTISFGFCKYIFTKVLLYSMLIYAITFCVKNYNAQMHNHVINIHKSNAFNSAMSLLDTARTDDGNDKILSQATQAIFSHQQTGYNGKESEPSNPNLVTNVIDSVSKKIQ